MGRSYDLELVGGTDVPWSPTSDYIERVVSPAMKAVGIGFAFKVGRRGYYPNGGGRASLRIEPCERVLALDLASQRGEGEGGQTFARQQVRRAPGQRGGEAGEGRGHRAASSRSGGGREGRQARRLGLARELACSSRSWERGATSAADSIGARGKPAETVGREASETFLTAFFTRARADIHLADMLAPVLCLADSPSALLIPVRHRAPQDEPPRRAGSSLSADHSVRDRGGATPALHHRPPSKIANNTVPTATIRSSQINVVRCIHTRSDGGRSDLQGRGRARGREEDHAGQLRAQQEGEEGLHGHRQRGRRLRRDGRRHAEPREGGRASTRSSRSSRRRGS